MPLSEASTYEEIRAALMANAGFATSNSLAMAQEYEKACLFLMLTNPRRMQFGTTETEFDNRWLESELARVRGWISSYSGGGVRALVPGEYFRG